MSLKAELEVWASALAAYDAEKFDEALELFSVSPPPTVSSAVTLLTSPGNSED